MNHAAEPVYRKPTETIVVLFNLRIPGAAERFHNERSAWAEYGDVEALDRDHFALILRPCGAHRLAA